MTYIKNTARISGRNDRRSLVPLGPQRKRSHGWHDLNIA